MRRMILLFVLAFAQAVMALTVGYAVLNAYERNRPMQAVFSDGDRYESVSPSDPVSDLRLEEEEEASKDGMIRIGYRDREFIFPSEEIGLIQDEERMHEENRKGAGLHYLSCLFSAFLREYRSDITPRAQFDSDKFYEKLSLIQGMIDTQPKNANIDVVDWEIVKQSHQDGFLFELDANFEDLRQRLADDPFEKLMLETVEKSAVRQIPAKITDRMIRDIEVFIAVAKTKIPEDSDRELLKKVAFGVNKVLLNAAETKPEIAADAFTLNKWLKEQGLDLEVPKSEYDQMATTLYIAALRAGIEIDKISREAVTEPVSYCDPGFGTTVFENGTDFVFVNTLPDDIIVFAAVEDDYLVVRIGGKRSSEDESDAADLEAAADTGTADEGSINRHAVYSEVVDHVAYVYRDGALLTMVELTEELER